MALTLLLGTAVAFTVANLVSARRELTAVQTHLRAARQAVATRDDSAARAALDRAGVGLQLARRRANALPLRILGPVPVVGSPGRALADAVRAGAEGVAAGRAVVAAASSFPTSGSARLDGHDLSAFHAATVRSGDALTKAQRHVAAASAALRGAARAALPQVSGPARAMRDELDANGRQLDGARQGLALVADLTRADVDARILVVSQDSLELRPTGGYIGSYGILRFFRGTVSLESYEATEDLPAPQQPLEPPAALAAALPGYWGLSNANWWPDFPTSAATARELFRRQGGGEVDGVLALTEHMLGRVVGAMGSVQVPGYAEPVVEEGFDQRAVYEVELKRPRDSPRKRFLIELSKIVFDRALNPPPDRFAAMVAAVDRSVGAGDVQLWFSDPARQRHLDGTVIAGRMPTPEGDFLMLVDANISASKANAGLVKQASYRVTRRDDGSLLSHLEITVRNDDPQSGVNPYYNSYLRIYVPQGSVVVDARAGQGQEETDERNGPFEVFTQLLLVEPGAQQKVTFDYEIPADLVSDQLYRLTLVRQVGTPRDSMTAVVDGRETVVPPEVRSIEIVRERRSNRVLEWLRGRWIIDKLGL